MKNNSAPPIKLADWKNMSDSPSSKISQLNNRKDMLEKKKKKKCGAANRKGTISRPEIEIPGRHKADGIKQVKILEQKKHHS